jgi:hypothetical protein
MNQDTRDPVDAFVRRADEVLSAAAKAPSVKHLRLAGVELLRAVRCGLDEAIEALDPKHDKHEGSTPPQTPSS